MPPRNITKLRHVRSSDNKVQHKLHASKHSRSGGAPNGANHRSHRNSSAYRVSSVHHAIRRTAPFQATILSGTYSGCNACIQWARARLRRVFSFVNISHCTSGRLQGRPVIDAVPFAPGGDSRHPSRDALASHRHGILSTVGARLTGRKFTPSFHRVNRTTKLGDPSSIGRRLRILSRGNFVHVGTGGKETVRIIGLGSRRPGKGITRIVPFPDRSSTYNSVVTSRSIPLIKHVTTNIPVATRRRISSIVELPRQLANANGLFVLRIRNSSVVSTTVYSNSFIIIHRRGDTRGNSVITTLLSSRTAIGAFHGSRNRI